MSIILKGIDLPRNGDCHHITIYDNGNTYITTSNVLYETDRKDVEAIQIPKDHGRLIDGDELRKEFNRTESGYCGGWEFCDKPEDVQLLIDETPTILEAEE